MTNNPHDKLFRAVFSNPENAVEHFRVLLPPAIVQALALEQAEHVPGSWVDEVLREHHSDLLFAIPFQTGEEPDPRPEGAGWNRLHPRSVRDGNVDKVPLCHAGPSGCPGGPLLRLC